MSDPNDWMELLKLVVVLIFNGFIFWTLLRVSRD